MTPILVPSLVTNDSTPLRLLLTALDESEPDAALVAAAFSEVEVAAAFVVTAAASTAAVVAAAAAELGAAATGVAEGDARMEDHSESEIPDKSYETLDQSTSLRSRLASLQQSQQMCERRVYGARLTHDGARGS